MVEPDAELSVRRQCELLGVSRSGLYYPAPAEAGAGARRIVVDDADGSTYYTWTHYGDSADPAFVQIR